MGILLSRRRIGSKRQPAGYCEVNELVLKGKELCRRHSIDTPKPENIVEIALCAIVKETQPGNPG